MPPNPSPKRSRKPEEKAGEKQRVTLGDIAQKAKVTIATVSMALRNNPRISPATRVRIQGLAKAMGYRPDPMLSWLTTYRKGSPKKGSQATLAWINTWDNPKKPYAISTVFPHYFEGARRRAEEIGFRLEEFCLRAPEMNEKRLSRILWSRGVAGLLIPPHETVNAVIPMQWDLFSAVTFGYSVKSPDLHRITNAHFASALKAVFELQRRGYSRIGYCSVEEGKRRGFTDLSFYGGYIAGIKKIPGLTEIPPFVSKAHEAAEKESDFLAWMKKHRPDAVLVNELPIAYEWLVRSGRRIPDDIGYAMISVDKKDARLAGIEQRAEETGSIAVDFLVGMIRRHERGIPAIPVRILIDGVWKDGASVRPAPEGSPASTQPAWFEAFDEFA